MSGTNNNQPSTVKSYIDSGVAAVQSAVGSLTGKFYFVVFSISTHTCLLLLGHIFNSLQLVQEHPADRDFTGNPVDQREADNRKAHAEAERDASHATAKAGPFTLSSSGAATVDNKNRREGQTDQFIGSGKEFVGNAVGSESLKREGRDQNADGQGREAAGQISDYASGVGMFTLLDYGFGLVTY